MAMKFKILITSEKPTQAAVTGKEDIISSKQKERNQAGDEEQNFEDIGDEVTMNCQNDNFGLSEDETKDTAENAGKSPVCSLSKT